MSCTCPARDLHVSCTCPARVLHGPARDLHVICTCPARVLHVSCLDLHVNCFAHVLPPAIWLMLKDLPARIWGLSYKHSCFTAVHSLSFFCDFNFDKILIYFALIEYGIFGEARKHCFLASNWLKFVTLLQKYRTLLYDSLNL